MRGVAPLHVARESQNDAQREINTNAHQTGKYLEASDQANG